MTEAKRALIVALLGAFLYTTAGPPAAGVTSWCAEPSTFGGNAHMLFKQPCNSGGVTGSKTACTVGRATSCFPGATSCFL